MRWLTTLVFSLGGSGCLPFVVPPAKLSVGAGPAVGSIPRTSGTLEPRSVTTLRAGLHPLQLVEGASRRAFDLGLGYGGDFVFGRAPEHYDERAVAHGPYLEGAYYPVRLPVGSTSTFRWGARVNADLLFLEPLDLLGYGAMAATEIELSGDANGPFAEADEQDGILAGAAIGQWSIGAFLGGAVRAFPEARYGALTAGISVRIPFAFGVACCAWSWGSDATTTETTEHSEPHHHHAEPAKSPPPERVRAKPKRVEASLPPERVKATPRAVEDR